MSDLQVSTKYDYPKIDNSANNTLHMMVTMTAPEIVIDDEKRLPLDICAALDISGSMGGSKIRLMQESFEKFVDNLTVNDKISVVAFNSQVRVLTEEALFATPENKEKVKHLVKGLRANGGTNIGEALANCFELLSGAKRADNVIKRAILFTDGDPTVGVQSYDGLMNIVNGRKSNISISTFGYGSDHDPEILSGIAKKGRGNTFYLEKMEDCAEYFGTELGGLLTTFAKDIRMLLTPIAGVDITKILNNVEVSVISNGEEKDVENVPERIQVLLGEDKGDQVIIKPDDIYGEETKHIVVELESKSRRQDSALVKIEILYKEADTNEEKKIETEARVEFVTADQASDTPEIDVEEQRLLLDSAQAQYTARIAANQGNYDDAVSVLQQFGDQMEKCVCFASSNALQSVRGGLSDFQASVGSRTYNASLGTRMAYASSGMSRGRVTSKGLYGSSVMESLGSSKTVADFVSDNFQDEKDDEE